MKPSPALEYHQRPGRPGKTAIQVTKPCSTAAELSLAYTPGVAEPVRAIAANPQEAALYTNRSNLVGVVSNGSAVLGLGNQGALASKPVMEGKAVLFKRFADVDVFDIELNTSDPEEIIRTVELMEPTFGGINLEDIKAPECFYIEQELKRRCSIPIFHDDQHGTAIITAAGIINALQLTGRSFAGTRVVVNGAGAAAVACSDILLSLGITSGNLLMLDSKGVLHTGREDLNAIKQRFARETPARTLADALTDADVFVGVSVAGVLTTDMLNSMAASPIVFAMANPDPEITYPAAKAARSDVVMATGRSDYPNQINNVLGFPFIFRGALDVQASAISEGMKLAAAHALAELAREPVPAEVAAAYDGQEFRYGPEYLVPKPFDPRVMEWVSTAVARAATEEGIARVPMHDWDAYRDSLRKLSRQLR
ncbi:malic enzyme-like NAD(P)-binding protein [Spirochaeta africana]|uniref:Malic enzyme n=1 Tax=Spirochaeta africana (strain ATCC 700263 / DSM 8902 / Z-7692) TaxID=889378 RepID=H9UHC5_SPIAZ|nr:malic enzyme-like NAD(P)-binding protein [Spirochaeta africana]AFG36918.1 malic enzyme [Spirochaeta africana DSM 8902]